MGEDDMRPLVELIRPSDLIERKALLDDVHTGLFNTQGRPQSFGRYLLLRSLGVGGHGAVYEAYDPQLERKVAVKVLHPTSERRAPSSVDVEGDGGPTSRLMNEARALAKLCHPNIITIYDVGLLEADPYSERAEERDGVFIVMELVEGEELESWRRSTKRSRSEVVKLMVEVGRALAAAHTRSVVHGDFKPSNVVIGEDARSRILDFGLARFGSGEKKHGAGTPFYMAPELFQGMESDALSDQYSFCVTLWELVGNGRPFVADRPSDLQEMKRRGELPSARSAGIPVWLHRVLSRGLSHARSERFPSMDTLVHALERGLARPKRIWGAAFVSAFIGISAGAWLYNDDLESRWCEVKEREAVAGWNLSKQEALKSRFSSTSLPFAEASWNTTQALVQDYIDRWVGHRERLCKEAFRGGGGLESIKEPNRCLEDLEARLVEVLDLYAKAERQTVIRATEIAAELDDPEQCSLSPALVEDETTEREREIEVILSRMGTAIQVGHFEVAEEIGEEAKRLTATLDRPQLKAHLGLQMGKLALERGHGKEAFESLFEALQEAEAGGDDRLAVRVLTRLIFVTGRQLAEYEKAVQYAALADAKIKRAKLDLGLRVELGFNLGRTLEAQGDPKEAKKVLEDALRYAGESRGKTDPLIADITCALGVVHYRAGAFSESLRLDREAYLLRARLLGEGHPKTALARGNIGVSLNALGRHREASVELRAAVHSLERTLGEHPGLVFHRSDLALALTHIGEGSEAHRQAELALEEARRIFASDHPWLARALLRMAQVKFLVREEHEQALAFARGAHGILRAYPGNPFRRPTELLLAQVTDALGLKEESLGFYEAASFGCGEAPFGDLPECALANEGLRKAQGTR